LRQKLEYAVGVGLHELNKQVDASVVFEGAREGTYFKIGKYVSALCNQLEIERPDIIE